MISSLYILPTMECNCKCKYCYIPEQIINKISESFFKDILNQFITEFSNTLGSSALYELPQLRFIGGEPYLKAHLITDLSVNFLEKLPEGIVVFNTNATVIKKSYLDKMQQYRKRIYHIISMDGTEKIHNARRALKNGQSAFQEASKGIFKLKKSGFPVYLNMVLDNESIVGFSELCDHIITDFQMDSLSISLCSSPKYPMSQETKFSLLQRAYDIAEKKNILLGGHHRLHLAGRIPKLTCRAGTKSIVVTPEKKFYACQRFTGNPEHGKYFCKEGFGDIDLSVKSSTICYDSESIFIGDKLYDMYKTKYPAYLEKTNLDSILFGVI